MDYLKQQQLTLPIVEVYLSIEEQILINVAKRLKKHRSLMDDDIQSWQSMKLAELESLTQQNIITIAKHSGLAVDEISKMLKQAGYSSIREFEDDLQEAVRQGKLVQAPPVGSSTALEGILMAYQRQAKDVFNLINGTMLEQSKQIYIDILNQTVGKVLSGVLTPQQALREAAAKWAEKGIPALIDKSGKRWSTEAYISTVTRSMSNNVANDMQDARFDEYGVDLIEISSHAGARPLCAPYQGRIFSRSGKDHKYPPLSSTSYGEPAGIRGVNCGHVFYPYIPGVTRRTYKPYPKAENERIYKESQKQRYLERRIRSAKREKSMMESIGDEEGAKKASKKVRDRQAVMREFIHQSERTRRYDREQVV